MTLHRLEEVLSSVVDFYKALEEHYQRQHQDQFREGVLPCPTRTVVLLVLQDPKTSDELFPHRWCRLKQTGKTSNTSAVFMCFLQIYSMLYSLLRPTVVVIFERFIPL